MLHIHGSPCIQSLAKGGKTLTLDNNLNNSGKDIPDNTHRNSLRSIQHKLCNQATASKPCKDRWGKGSRNMGD